MRAGGVIVILEESFFKLALCREQKDVSNMTGFVLLRGIIRCRKNRRSKKPQESGGFVTQTFLCSWRKNNPKGARQCRH
jgi:hypothetical protein